MNSQYAGRIIVIHGNKYVSESAFVISQGNAYRRRELIQETCQKEGYVLVSERRLSVLSLLSQDSRYYPGEQTLFWDILIFIVDFCDLNSVQSWRGTCKEMLQHIDLNIDAAWRIVVLENRYATRITRIHDLLNRKPCSFKEYRSWFIQCFYTDWIHTRMWPEEELSLHMIKNNVRAIKKMRVIPGNVLRIIEEYKHCACYEEVKQYFVRKSTKEENIVTTVMGLGVAASLLL